MADARVRGERGGIQQLARAAGAEREEPLERREVADVQDAPHVALDVRADVGTKPRGWIHRAGIDRGVPAAEDRTRWTRCHGRDRLRESGDLAMHQWKQVKGRHATGKRLAQSLGEQQALRTREHPAPRGRIAVDELQQVREQRRNALHLVQDDAGCPGGHRGLEQAARVTLRRIGEVGRLEDQRSVAGESHARER